MEFSQDYVQWWASILALLYLGVLLLVIIWISEFFLCCTCSWNKIRQYYSKLGLINKLEVHVIHLFVITAWSEAGLWREQFVNEVCCLFILSNNVRSNCKSSCYSVCRSYHLWSLIRNTFKALFKRDQHGDRSIFFSKSNSHMFLCGLLKIYILKYAAFV
jgi:hypothetical protein